LIIVDVSASTGAFVGTVCLRYQEGARQVDEKRRGVLPTLPHLRHPVHPETERQTVIRQTVPTKAPVEAETSTIVQKGCFFKEFHFELVYSSTYI